MSTLRDTTIRFRLPSSGREHWRVLRAASLALAVLGGCDDPPPPEPAEEPTPAMAPGPEPAEAEEEVQDAGVDAGHDAGPPRPPARLFAKRFVSKVRERPDRDSFRIGYLRAGAVLMATTADPVRTDDPRCRGGWYELTTGGFVCNGRDVIAFWGRRLPQARGIQAARASPMPYPYGRNRRDQAPMYRRLPTDDDAVELEGFRIPGQDPPPAADGASQAASPAAAARTENPPAAPAASEPPTTTAAAPVPAPTTPAPTTPAPTAGSGEPEEPADPITLESLQGDRNSALLRRMMRGFIVSLDREFRAGRYNRRYWRTVNNGFVPYGAIGRVTPPDFEGTAIDELHGMPIGYILSRSGVVYYTRGAEGRPPRRGRAAPFHHRLHIVGEEVINNTTYFVAADGRLYRERDVRRIEPRARPAEVGANEKWIEINLTGQYLIAYEGDRPVYATLISSGRAHVRGDPEADYLTPTGTFRVRAKHVASAMDGDTASDGPYSIDDVPWVMYFQLAYALHGAFWHNGFGFPRSHGCVNLAPADARWVFNWSDPQVPEGWHGAYPTEASPGTLLYVHGETPGRRR